MCLKISSYTLQSTFHPTHLRAEPHTHSTSSPNRSCSTLADATTTLQSGLESSVYLQARFRSFTCASLLVIMVAKTRPKRTPLINT